MTADTQPQSRDGHELDMQLRRRSSDPPWNREPRLQILDCLGVRISLHLLISYYPPLRLHTNTHSSVISTAFIPVTYLFYPETANRTLEDIDRYFDANREVIVFRNKHATQLSRPEIYAEEDERIAQGHEKDVEWDAEAKEQQTTVEEIAKV